MGPGTTGVRNGVTGRVCIDDGPFDSPFHHSRRLTENGSWVETEEEGLYRESVSGVTRGNRGPGF